MDKKRILYVALSGFTLFLMLLLFLGGLGKNNAMTWQIKQSLSGSLSVIDRPGWYLKLFSTIHEYPRSVQRYWSEDKSEASDGDEAIKVTFNDGGTADMSTMIRYSTPVETELRLKLHRDFAGQIKNVTESVRAHMNNCLKATAPLMSASEHQSARMAEFTQLVYEQLEYGLYEMKKIEKTLEPDETSDGSTSSRKITIFATEIVRDSQGKPKIAQPSPLKEYGIHVQQFSITGTSYDPETMKQFAAKKELFLNAEKAKAAKEQEVQQRMMVVEKGLREKAEVEAQSNKERAAAVINAEREREVAEIEAQQKVLIAEQNKIEQETKASALLSVAEIKKKEAQAMAEAAKFEAEAIVTLARAQEEKIKSGGAITEAERILAEIKAKRDIEVAASLSQVKSPQVLIIGGEEGNTNTLQHLINVSLMKNLSIWPTTQPN